MDRQDQIEICFQATLLTTLLQATTQSSLDPIWASGLSHPYDKNTGQPMQLPEIPAPGSLLQDVSNEIEPELEEGTAECPVHGKILEERLKTAR